MICEQVKLNGRVEILVIDNASGAVIESRSLSNLIVDMGKNFYARITGDSTFTSTIRQIALGKGTLPAAASDTNLGNPLAVPGDVNDTSLAIATVTRSNPTSKMAKFVATFPAGPGSLVTTSSIISEIILLFDTSDRTYTSAMPISFTADGGVFARIGGFAPFAKDASRQVVVSWYTMTEYEFVGSGCGACCPRQVSQLEDLAEIPIDLSTGADVYELRTMSQDSTFLDPDPVPNDGKIIELRIDSTLPRKIQWPVSFSVGAYPLPSYTSGYGVQDKFFFEFNFNRGRMWECIARDTRAFVRGYSSDVQTIGTGTIAGLLNSVVIGNSNIVKVSELGSVFSNVCIGDHLQSNFYRSVVLGDTIKLGEGENYGGDTIAIGNHININPVATSPYQASHGTIALGYTLSSAAYSYENILVGTNIAVTGVETRAVGYNIVMGNFSPGACNIGAVSGSSFGNIVIAAEGGVYSLSGSWYNVFLSGASNSIGDNTNHSVGVGSSITMSNCDYVTVVGNSITNYGDNNVIIGKFSFAGEVATPVPGNVVIGDSCGVTGSSGNVAIGQIARVMGGSGSVALGQATIIGSSSQSFAASSSRIGNSSSGTAAIVASVVGDSCAGSFAASSSTIGNNSDSCIAMVGSTIGTGCSASIALCQARLGNSVVSSVAIGEGARLGNSVVSSIAIGDGALVDAGFVACQAYGASAHAQEGNNEVVFGGVTTSVRVFHAISSIPAGGGANHDLLRFTSDAVFNVHDSAMYLLYKNAAGNTVSQQVTIDPVTGALTVPL